MLLDLLLVHRTSTKSKVILQKQLSSSNKPINADRHIVGEIQAVIGHMFDPGKVLLLLVWVKEKQSPTITAKRGENLSFNLLLVYESLKSIT